MIEFFLNHENNSKCVIQVRYSLFNPNSNPKHNPYSNSNPNPNLTLSLMLTLTIKV
jgi:hypothetical protein